MSTEDFPPIVIETAMKSETAWIAKSLRNAKEWNLGGYPVIEGSWNEYPVILVRNRIGLVNAAICTQRIIDYFHPRCILSIGTAGAYLEDLHAGDVIIGHSVRCVNSSHMEDEHLAFLRDISEGEWTELETYHSADWIIRIAESIPVSGGQIHIGAIGSADFWSREAEEIHRIVSHYDVVCEDMEAYSVAKVCRDFRTDFLAFKIISNNELTGEQFRPELTDRIQSLSALLVARIISELRKELIHGTDTLV